MKPTEINLHKVSRVLELSFEDGSNFKLPVEYLTPSMTIMIAGFSAGIISTNSA
jgi:DUF971 family protein